MQRPFECRLQRKPQKSVSVDTAEAATHTGLRDVALHSDLSCVHTWASMFYYFFCIPTYTCCVRRYTELSCIATTHSVTTSDTALLPQLCPNFCFYVLPLLYIYLHVSFHSLGFHFAVICRNTRKAGVSVLYLAILFQFSLTSCELPHVRHV